MAAMPKEWVLSRIQKHWQDISRPDFPYPLPIQKTLEETVQQIEAQWPDGYTEEEWEQMNRLFLYEPDMPDYIAIRPKLRGMKLDYFDNHFGPMTDEEVRQKAATWMFPEEMIDELNDIRTICLDRDPMGLHLGRPDWLPLYYELMEKLQQSPESPWQPGRLTPEYSAEHFAGYPVAIYHLASERLILTAAYWNSRTPLNRRHEPTYRMMEEIINQGIISGVDGKVRLHPPEFLRTLPQYVQECQSQISVHPASPAQPASSTGHSKTFLHHLSSAISDSLKHLRRFVK